MEGNNIGKVLVIHPVDPSTAYLSKIYDGMGWDILTEGSVKEVRDAIESHDTIVMLGHGTPAGLLDFRNQRYIVTEAHASSLSGKNLIGIWCHANMYFNRHNLDGFYTGMVISEVEEACIFKYEVTEEENDRQFREFCEAVRVAVEKSIGDPEGMKRVILEEYKPEDGMTGDLKMVYQYNRNSMLPKKFEFNPYYVI